MNRAGIHELECFVAVAEELNFSRAAKRLHMSQPPLTRQIQSLEEKLGLRLLDRNTRSVVLTPGGLLYLQDVRHILTRLDAAAASAQRSARGETSRLRLSFVGALLDEELVGVLKDFRRLHDGCQLDLADLPPAAQLEGLLANRVDGAFIGAAPRKLDKRFFWFVWKREPLLVAMPKQHPLASVKALVLSQLKNEKWVMVSRAAAAAFRQQFDTMCSVAGIRPQVVQESERVPAVLTMIAVEQGISLLPESVSRLVHPGVVFRPLRAPTAVLEHAFAYKNGHQNDLVSNLATMLIKAGRRPLP